MSSSTAVIVHVDDEAWVRFVVEGLELDGHHVHSERWPPTSTDGVDLLLVVCTPAARGELEWGLDAVRTVPRIVPVLRDGTPESAIPPALHGRPWLDLREGSARLGELERIWALVRGEPLPEPRPTPAEMERHLVELGEREGPSVAGWSAVTFADEAHGRDDFVTEWVLRRVAAQLLRRGGEIHDALVQARQGLAAAVIANMARGIRAHDALVAELEAELDGQG